MQRENNLEELLGVNIEEQRKEETLDECKRRTILICKSLIKPANSFDASDTLRRIRECQNIQDFNRILYSEISSFAYGLESTRCGTLLTNVESLASYVHKEPGCDDCRKIVLKIYDHCSLAVKQTRTIREAFDGAVKQAESLMAEQYRDDFKRLEKEYVTVLGIFMSVVVTIVGGMSFSTSVLSNIPQLNVHGMIAGVLILAIVLIAILYMLMRFIFVLNDKEFECGKIVGGTLGALFLFLIFWISKYM